VGEVTEFAQFVEEQLPRLRSYVARMPGAKDAGIEDLLQEALLRAYEARERFESDAHAVNWICQVVRNLLVDRHRRSVRRPVLPHADLDELGERAPDPADLVAAAEQANLAVRALGRLSQAQRDLLWEHAVDGVSYADIARRTATPLATVRSLAHRARLAAMREFAQAGGALAAMPALAARPWRRLAHKLSGVPPAALDTLAAAGAVVVAVALPIGAVPATVPAALPAAPSMVSSGPQMPAVANIPASLGQTDPAPVVRHRTVPAPAGASATDPKELVQSVQTGTFTGTYSSDCTFSPRTVRVIDNYDCTFSGVSRICRIKLRGSQTAPTGCTVELLPTDVVGIADGADGFGVESPARHCWNGGSGTGHLRFRLAPGSRPMDLPVQLVMGESEVDVYSENVKVLGLSGSFPFSCVVPHQENQIGFHGTLGY
jgi:RNA polymerase sigma-70 factor, ECF subfamily